MPGYFGEAVLGEGEEEESGLAGGGVVGRFGSCTPGFREDALPVLST
jgi:hypothetical protein